MINLSSLQPGLLGASPYSNVRQEVLVPGASVAFEMDLPRLDIPIQATLDGWPDREYGKTVFIRVRTQGLGCTFKCKSCWASTLPHGVQLTSQEIVFQVIHILLSGLVDLRGVDRLVVATMGLGEPFANYQVVDALRELNFLIPACRFIISTTGPRTGKKVFDSALEMCRQGVRIDFQISVHSVRQEWRLEFIGDIKHQGRPLASWTVEELSLRAREWYEATGNKAHINLAVGPSFHGWDAGDHDGFAQLFPSDIVVVKLSLEGPYDGQPWDQAQYYAALLHRQTRLQEMGYPTYEYIPAGVDVGGSCGAQLDIRKLVQVQPQRL